MILYSYKILFFVLSFSPKNNNIIIFDSFSGRYYSDNPRAIYEYLKIHHPKFKMYWAANKHFRNNFVNRDLDILIRFTPKWLFYMCRAKFWVSNSRFPLWFYKSKKTIFVQTWHGTPLKKLALDLENVHIATHDTETYKKEFEAESSRWNYLISPNKYSSLIFKRAFNYNNNLLEVGYPRNDFLIQNNTQDTINEIKKIYKLPKDKKIFLYAPTWRDDNYNNNQFIFNLYLDLEKFKQTFDDDWIILLRLHYNVAHDLDLANYKSFAYDFSDVDDIRELYIIADLLITDYSSVFFDFSLLQKPIVFFMYDLEVYRDVLRGFYFNIEEAAPKLIAKTNDELIYIIQQQLKINFETHYGHVFSQFNSLEDGKATKRVVETIFFNNNKL